VIAISKNKQKHLLAGLALSILAGLFVYPMFGLLIAAAVGALKKIIWDWWWKRGTPEWWDSWATVLGGVLGAVILHAARRCYHEKNAAVVDCIDTVGRVCRG
jgi:hypothetical protein